MTTQTFDWSSVQNITFNGTDIHKIDLTPTGGLTNFTVTVVSSGGNKFALNGATTPVITLQRGVTYTFDQSDSTNSGHPLAFRDSSDNSYTTGVTVTGTAGQAGAKVEFAVPSNAPATLKYYCTVHGNGMGTTATIIANNSSTAVEMWRKVYVVQSETQQVWVPPVMGWISSSYLSHPGGGGSAEWYVSCSPNPGYTWTGVCGNGGYSCGNCPAGTGANCAWTNVGGCPWYCTVDCYTTTQTWGQTAAGYYQTTTVDTSYYQYFY